MAKSLFGVVGHHVARTYAGDVVIPAGVAVVGGAAKNSVALPGAANQRALGVSALATVNPGDPVPVIELGEVTAIADAPIARMQWVGINAVTGQFAPIGSGNLAGLGQFEAVGVALEAAVQQGDEFLLFVIPTRMPDNSVNAQSFNINLNTIGNGAILAPVLVSRLITRGGAQAGAAFTDTTDTAAAIIASLPGAQIGMSFFVDILNKTNAQQTIAPGAGVTLSGVTQIGQNCRATFLVAYTGAGAISMYGLSVVDIGIDNFNGVGDPGVNQDSTQGYGVGSIYFNTNAGQLRWWECRDSSAGAAKWVFSGADYANGGTEPNSSVIQAGSSTAVLAGEGNMNRQVPGVAAAVAPGAIGQDNVVAVFAVPANFFDQAGRGITVTGAGVFAANANNKRIKLIFNPANAVVGAVVGAGGTVMADTGVVATNGGGWEVSGNVFKRGAAGSNTQTVTSNGAAAGGVHSGVTPPADTVAAENAPILIAVTINNTTNVGDASLAWFEVNGMN